MGGTTKNMIDDTSLKIRFFVRLNAIILFFAALCMYVHSRFPAFIHLSAPGPSSSSTEDDGTDDATELYAPVVLFLLSPPS